MDLYHWTLDEIDGTELEFLLDLLAVNWKCDPGNKNIVGNADSLGWL